MGLARQVLVYSNVYPAECSMLLPTASRRTYTWSPAFTGSVVALVQLVAGRVMVHDIAVSVPLRTTVRVTEVFTDWFRQPRNAE